MNIDTLLFTQINTIGEPLLNRAYFGADYYNGKIFMFGGAFYDPFAVFYTFTAPQLIDPGIFYYFEIP